MSAVEGAGVGCRSCFYEEESLEGRPGQLKSPRYGKQESGEESDIL